MKKSLTAVFAVIIAVMVVTAIAIIAAISVREKPTVAITFDVEYPYGVPNDLLEQANERSWIDTINEIASIAESHDITFQFNVLGKTAEIYPELIKELGLSQDISCHTYSHLHQTGLNSSQKEFEIAKCKEILESITSREIEGNRFPYTDCDNESFTLLKKHGYNWDSSLWATSLAELKPYSYKGLIEFPILPATTDWRYFIHENKNDVGEFYDALYNDIASINDKDVVYVVSLHPWVLSLDENRIEGLNRFVGRLKDSKIKIDSLDNIYKRLIA